MPPERPDYLKLFLAAITRNLSLDRLKERKTAKRGGGAAALALDELSECVSGSPEVEDAVIAKELSESVGRFLDTLPPETRKLFLRRYFFLESAEEIALNVRDASRNGDGRAPSDEKKLREHLKGRDSSMNDSSFCAQSAMQSREYLAQSEETKKAAQPWKRWTALAACACLIVGLGAAAFAFVTRGASSTPEASPVLLSPETARRTVRLRIQVCFWHMRGR